MRSSRRRSTPACGEATQGNVSVAITTRCEKSALMSSFDMMRSSKAFGERAKIHLVRPCGRMLYREIETSLRNCLGRHPDRWRCAEALFSLHLVDQAVEHEMGDMHAAGAEFTRQRLRQPAQGELCRSEGRKICTAADAGGGAGEDDGSLLTRGHMRDDGLRGQHRAETGDAPDMLELDVPNGLISSRCALWMSTSMRAP